MITPGTNVTGMAAPGSWTYFGVNFMSPFSSTYLMPEAGGNYRLNSILSLGVMAVTLNVAGSPLCKVPAVQSYLNIEVLPSFDNHWAGQNDTTANMQVRDTSR